MGVETEEDSFEGCSREGNMRPQLVGVKTVVVLFEGGGMHRYAISSVTMPRSSGIEAIPKGALASKTARASAEEKQKASCSTSTGCGRRA